MSKDAWYKKWLGGDDEDEGYQGYYDDGYGLDSADPNYTGHKPKRYQPGWDDDYGYGGYRGSYGNYGYYNYKPKFNMSVSLEIRVTQLIKSITGKKLRLARADGWGADDKFFYYNPDDLLNATDDEVLGIIFHQLGREIFYEQANTAARAKRDPKHRHLIERLEDLRTDYRLVERYGGAQYYIGEAYPHKKKGQEPQRSGGDITEEDVRDYARGKGLPYDKVLEQVKHRMGGQDNLSWHFLYGIFCRAYGDDDYQIDPEIEKKVQQALPHLEEYLATHTFSDTEKAYQEIKKLYPEPSEEEQESMDENMGQGQGQSLTEDQRGEARADAEEIESESAPRDLEAANKRGLTEQEKQTNRNHKAYIDEAKKRRNVTAVLHKLLNSIMKDNEVKRFARPFKRGKLDPKSLYKLHTTKNLRIFKKPRINAKKRYAMSILIDQSGSMSGENIVSAFGGAVVLTEVLTKLGIPFEITGFDTHSRIYKNFESTPRYELIGGITSACGGGTNDRDALSRAKDRILKYDASHAKLIFVVGDGDGCGEQMKSLAEELEDKHGIRVVGIGIGDVSEVSLQRSYRHYLKVDDVTQLPKTLVQVAKSQFRRG